MEEEHEQENNVKDEEIEEVEAVIESSDQSKTEVTEEDFAHFIGKNADKYLSKFGEFTVRGADKFALTWHWPVFFFGFLWMLYRKLYLWALLAFFLPIIAPFVSSYFNLLIMIAWGMTGNYIYYKHAKKKILKLKTDQSCFDLSLMATSLRKIGGVNRWVPYIALLMAIVGILAAISIPGYAPYKTKSYNASALADLMNAVTAQEAYYVDTKTYADSIERLTGSTYGLYVSENVKVLVLSANKSNYVMVAFHEKGNKRYVIKGPDGKITEVPE